MERIFTYQVQPGEEGLRIEQYLSRRGYSRPVFAALKKQQNSVLVNDKPFFLNQRISAGDILTVHLEEEKCSSNVLPAKLPLDILYEDEDILVVNKPAGMPTHPSGKNSANSLASALAWYYKEQNIPFVFRCSHRLDQDTSGLTVIARHMVSSAVLSGMAVRREIKREYLGIVRGHVFPPEGTIRAPLIREEGRILRQKVDFEKGGEAITHYQVVDEKNGHSLVLIQLETGRTHQIRVHMKYLGFPLIGDYLYNPDMENIHRQALHSYRLTFRHPVTGEIKKFTAPLPDDMQQVLRP